MSPKIIPPSNRSSAFCTAGFLSILHLTPVSRIVCCYEEWSSTAFAQRASRTYFNPSRLDATAPCAEVTNINLWLTLQSASAGSRITGGEKGRSRECALAVDKKLATDVCWMLTSSERPSERLRKQVPGYSDQGMSPRPHNTPWARRGYLKPPGRNAATQRGELLSSYKAAGFH